MVLNTHRDTLVRCGRWARILGLLLLSGCSALPHLGPTARSVASEQLLSAASNETGSKPEAAKLMSCEEYADQVAVAALSILAIDRRGHYLPVKFNDRECVDSETIKKYNHPGYEKDKLNLSDSKHYGEQHVENIVRKIKQDMASTVLIYIHGGLNTRENGLGRAIAHANMIREYDNSIYPIFINWVSDGLDAYTDQVFNNHQGNFDVPYKHTTSPLYFLADIGEGVVRGPATMTKSIKRLADSGAEDFTSPANIYCRDEKGNDPDKYEQSPGFVCSQEGSREDVASLFQTIRFASMAPVTVLTSPFADSFGKTAWDAMVARTQVMFHPPEEFTGLPDPKRGSTGSGALATLLEKLQEKIGKHIVDPKKGEVCPSHRRIEDRPSQCENKTRVWIIGHSMGTIVANEILVRFPYLPYSHIVYMGGAASIKDTVRSIDAAMSYNGRVKFHNLSIHPFLEAREFNGGGTVPPGTLLEWIDDMYTVPSTMLDRTVGQWRNVFAAQHVFRMDLRTSGRMIFKRFGLSCRNPIHHGDFDEILPDCTVEGRKVTPLRYWQQEYWTVPEPKATAADRRPTRIQRVRASRSALGDRQSRGPFAAIGESS
ncbi:MAG TPA: hypothetical protein VEH84_06970 [Alphaproteobacteria bacterium]|nr:hypothetical protein [Alphaproteobacteria bacterium]